MDVMHLCRCCLRRSPDKDLTSPCQNQVKTETYAQMLQECYNIPLVLSGLGSAGICSVCVGRLRDAHDFKLQVQWSQAELQEWLRGEFSDKGEAEDRLGINSPSRPTYERRSRSRVPSRSRSRSQLRSRGQSGSLPNRNRSRSRSRPRSRSDARSRASSRSRATNRSRATSRSRASRSRKDNRHILDTHIYEKLEILLHNISSSLASAPTITDINTFRDHCRSCETIKFADSREPPGRRADTLAPEFADADSIKQNSNNNNENSSYINNNKCSKQYNSNENNIKNNKSNNKIQPVKTYFVLGVVTIVIICVNVRLIRMRLFALDAVIRALRLQIALLAD